MRSTGLTLGRLYGSAMPKAKWEFGMILEHPRDRRRAMFIGWERKSPSYGSRWVGLWLPRSGDTSFGYTIGNTVRHMSGGWRVEDEWTQTGA